MEPNPSRLWVATQTQPQQVSQPGQAAPAPLGGQVAKPLPETAAPRAANASDYLPPLALFSTQCPQVKGSLQEFHQGVSS